MWNPVSGKELVKERLSLKGIDPLLLCGRLDENLKLLSRKFDIDIVLRGNNIILCGEPEKISLLKLKILSLIKEIKEGKTISKEDLGSPNPSPTVTDKQVIVTSKRLIKPRTSGQVEYLKALNSFDVIVCIGPAGTGKTYLAVAKAVELLKKGVFRRIILTRPAVEAGERLGFLPGDFKEKVEPYLRPLYDALYELMPHDKIRHCIEDHTIEVAPLAYMRGRNLDNSFVILDEAQNTGKGQMKMFLTRLGIGSKACITGDITQIDLENPNLSGLLHIQQVLSGIRGIKFVKLSKSDILRHPLVKKIVEAYENETESFRDKH